MKFARSLGALMVVALVLSCAQPPKAEADAARAKVATIQKDVDILTYAPDTLQQAKDALARMEKNLSAKKYPEAKAAALQATSLSDGAKSDVAAAKERVKGEATTLIAEGKKQLAALLPLVSTAKRARPAGLDLAALDKDLLGARSKLADADTAFGNGNFAGSRDAAATAKATFSELEKRISDAVQKNRAKK